MLFHPKALPTLLMLVMGGTTPTSDRGSKRFPRYLLRNWDSPPPPRPWEKRAFVWHQGYKF